SWGAAGGSVGAGSAGAGGAAPVATARGSVMPLGPIRRGAGGAGPVPIATSPFTLPVIGATPDRSGRKAPSLQSTSRLPASQLSGRIVSQNSVSFLSRATFGPPAYSATSRLHSSPRKPSCAPSSG